jgi:hypothetical protein
MNQKLIDAIMYLNWAKMSILKLNIDHALIEINWVKDELEKYLEEEQK